MSKVIHFTLDPKNPPKLTATEAARLDAMSDAEVTAAALTDPDNVPLSNDELMRMETSLSVRRARQRTGLSQTGFARAFHINVARLRDLEQGRTRADSALLAYLAVIEREPEAVRRALD